MTTHDLIDKKVMLQIRASKPNLATIKNVEPNGIWIASAGSLTAAAGVMQQIQNPAFFVPWTSIDWVAVQSTF